MNKVDTVKSDAPTQKSTVLQGLLAMRRTKR